MDAIDRELLEALQADCKTPLARLGELVGLSAPSVLDRVRKLEAAGVITGYHAAVDGRRVGLDITAFIGVSINYPKAKDRVLAALLDRPDVLECHHVTGAHTLLLKTKTENTACLERLIFAIRQVDGVTDTDTMVVLSTAQERGRVPLPAIERAPSPRRKRR